MNKLNTIILLSLFLQVFSCTKKVNSPEPKATSVLLISIDTLRADHLSMNGYNRNTAPFIEELASNGSIFENTFVPLPATSPSHASLFSGQHPLKHKVLSNGSPLNEKVETLAQVFKKNSYYTMGVISVEHLKGEYGFSRGFDEYSDDWKKNKDDESAYTRNADKTNEVVEEYWGDYLDKHADKPFFLFVHYFDLHAPYIDHKNITFDNSLSDKFTKKLKPDLLEMVENYDKEIKYVDAHIEKIINMIKLSKRDKNLLVVITSDHGEQFGEHGYFAGHTDMYLETVKVPLVFVGKNIPKQKIVENVSSMDTPVSILNLVGLKFGNEVQGINLFGKKDKHRELLTVGYPGYALSAGMIQGDSWYIENMDYIFKFMFFPEAAKSSQNFKKIERARSELDENIYSIQYKPNENIFVSGFISLKVKMKNKTCDGKLSVQLEQSHPYLPYDEFYSFKDIMQIDYPVRPYDFTTVKISPKDCIQSVGFTSTDYVKYLSSVVKETPKRETEIFKRLKSERKEHTNNELFKFMINPEMDKNLIADKDKNELAKYLSSLLKKKYTNDSLSTNIKTVPGVEKDSKTIEALKSLGYLQ